MENDPNQAMRTMAPILPLVMFGLLAFVLSFLPQNTEVQWKNSLETADVLQAHFILEFFLFALLYIPLYIWVVNRFKKGGAAPIPNARLVAFAMTEFPLLLGFSLAFVNYNAYLFLPFAGISLLLYVYAWSISSEFG